MTLLRFGISVVLTAALWSADSGYNLFQRGLAKERAESDPRAAIKIYEQVVREYVKDRKLAAQALIRLGECYEKLGEAGSRKVYERVLREYSDQKEAATIARTRLGESTKPAGGGVMQRFVRTERNIGSTFSPSPDGRYLVFGNLALHDLATGLVRDIPRTSGGSFSFYPQFTPDSKRIVYTSRAGNATELRIIALDGTGMKTVLRTSDYRYFVAHSISPDGGTVATLLGLIDQTWQIALVSLDSGKVRVLKTVGWERPEIGNFSPDGRWIVYSLRTQDANAADHEVYSIATDGSAEFRIASAVARSTTPYFSPDGSRAVFVGERLGKRILWAVRVANGRPLGAPEVLKTDVGFPMGFATNGSLYLREDSFRIGVFHAGADPHTWKVSSAAKEVSSPQRQSAAVDPAWSPDGKLLAYAVQPTSALMAAYPVQILSTYSKTTNIVIRNYASGQERELAIPGGRLRGWYPDSNSLLVDRGPGGLRTVEIATGKERVLIDREVGLPAASVDGKAIFYFVRDSGIYSPPGRPRPNVDTVRIMRREIGTDEAKELCHLEASRGIITDLSPSPDGRHVAFIALVPSHGHVPLFVASASGGPLREVQRPSGTLEGGFAWTGDSKALLFTRGAEGPSQASQIWAIPIDGSAPYAAGIQGSRLYSLSVHPDGHIAFTDTIREADQVSILENLFSKVSKEITAIR